MAKKAKKKAAPVKPVKPATKKPAKKKAAKRGPMRTSRMAGLPESAMNVPQPLRKRKLLEIGRPLVEEEIAQVAKLRRDGLVVVAEPVPGRSIRGTEPRTRRWDPPVDMPDWQVLAVAEGRMCGHRLYRVPARGGTPYCVARPDSESLHATLPARCRFHGCANKSYTAPQEVGMRHGIYSDALLPGEEEAASDGKLAGSGLSAEITMMRLRLRRALAAESKQEEAKRCGEDVGEVISKKSSSGAGTMGDVFGEEYEVRVVDYGAAVDRCLRQLIKLLDIQHRMTTGGLDMSASERARRAREALDAAKEGL